MSRLYYAAGCMVCPESVSAGTQTDFANPNMRLLEQPNLLRRPESRDEKVAAKLGFRSDELLSGY
eukprot:1560102-Prymnesium_polylepis.1